MSSVGPTFPQLMCLNFSADQLQLRCLSTAQAEKAFFHASYLPHDFGNDSDRVALWGAFDGGSERHADGTELVNRTPSHVTFSRVSCTHFNVARDIFDPLRTSTNDKLDTMAEDDPLTGYEPNFIDNYHETTDIFIQESSSDGKPSNLHDLEFNDYTIGRALSSPLFQEREDPGSRAVNHAPDESLWSRKFVACRSC